jgi:hypothetical protein
MTTHKTYHKYSKITGGDKYSRDPETQKIEDCSQNSHLTKLLENHFEKVCESNKLEIDPTVKELLSSTKCI